MPASLTGWLGQARAVCAHELRLLLYAPLTYVFQAGFLLALTLCVFFVAAFTRSDEASIRPLLVFLPWVALVFVPALGMRAWSDDAAEGTLELMLTLPLRLSALVLGKFLAGYAVLLLTLALTAPFPLTVAYLGEPDAGAIAGGYFGAALLLGAYYAVALLAAAVWREHTAAFVAAMITLFTLLLLGWDGVTRALHGKLSPGLLDALAYLSPKTWLDALGLGVIQPASVAYFLVLGALALLGSAHMIVARRHGRVRARDAVRAAAIALLALAGLGLLLRLLVSVGGALDLTAEREHTLHPATVSMLTGLPHTEVTLYWSESETEVPAAVRAHARRIVALLRAMTHAAGGNLQLRLLDPEPDTDTELTALNQGIQRVPMSSGDHFYLGARFTRGARATLVPYFDLRRERLHEYDIAVALNGLRQTRPRRVGVLSPLLAPRTAQSDRAGLSFMSELRKAYDLAVIPYFDEALPAGLDVLILAQPLILQQSMLYAIDQYLMNGGRIIALLDPYVRFDPGSNQLAFKPSDDVNSLLDLLARYGLALAADQVLGDAALATTVNAPGGGSLTYPYWLSAGADAVSAAHPVSASLEQLMFAEPGAWQVHAGTRAQPLVSTGERSGHAPRDDFLQHSPEALAATFTPRAGPQVIALVRSGHADSAFAGPPSPQTVEHLARSTSEPLVFAVADVDWLFDPFAVRSIELDGRTLLQPINDNLAFLLNMIEFAAGDPALLSIRARGRLQRTFTRLERMFRDAQAQYREEQAALTQHLADAEQRLARLAQSGGGQRLPRELRAELSRAQEALLPLRKRMRDLRRRMRESVDALSRRLTALNLLSGPLLVLALAALAHAQRRRRRPL